jgi:hypothetical protein
MLRFPLVWMVRQCGSGLVEDAEAGHAWAASPKWSRCDNSRANPTPWVEFLREAREESVVNDNRSPAKSATEARQGQTTGVVRWVLGVSLASVIVGLLIAYFAA